MTPTLTVARRYQAPYSRAVEEQAAGSPAFGDVFHLVEVDGDRIARIRVFITFVDALEAAAE